MRRAWVVGVVVGVLAATACSGGGDDTAPSTTFLGVDTTSTTTAPVPTLGLTPIETLPPTTLDTLPGADEVDTTVPTSATSEPTTLPSPAPPPIPLAHEDTVQIGYLEIPKLGVAQKLFEGVTLKTLDFGPGHWPGTALPGQTGNVVIAGHRTSHTRPFRDLDLLRAGDEVILSTAQGRHVYLVRKIQIVNPDALWIIDQTPDKTATLFACHPKGTTDKRIVAFLTYAPDRSTPSV